jgi:hypothetical protein
MSKEKELQEVLNEVKVMGRDEFVKFVLSLQEEPKEEEKEEI